MSVETIEKLIELNGGEEGEMAPNTIAGYARFEAMRVLLENWKDHVQQGGSLSDLTGDLDALVDEIGQFRKAVEHEFNAAANEAGSVPGR